MASLNKVILIGNVGKDPEIRQSQDGRENAQFSLATSESWKDKITGEKKEKVEWHKIVIFSSNIVNVVRSYVKKGSKIYIEGTLQTRKWTDNSGVEKWITEVILQNYNSSLVLLDNKSHDKSYDESGAEDNKRHQNKKEDFSIENDEIPF